MPIAVGDLVQNQNIVSVSASSSLSEALNLMIEYDFSQLPILDKNKKPIGVVTSTSIARALLRFAAKVEDLSVSDATVRIPDYPADEDLLYILDNILQHSVVFIVDAASKSLIGILTEYDTTQYFRQRAEDIVLVEDIENALKAHLLNAYEATETESTELREAINGLNNSWDGIRKKTDSCLRSYSKANGIAVIKADIDALVIKHFPKNSDDKSFSDLTLSEFIQIAQKNWQKLAPVFSLSSSVWVKMIDEVREIRNKLVHFRGDISALERHSLRFCADWFKAHPVLSPTNDADGQVAETSNIVHEELEAITDENVIATNHEAIDRAIKIKYSMLVEHLLPLAGPTHNMMLYDVASKVKGDLPMAARLHTTWWTDVSAHSQQWLEVGWEIRRVNLATSNALVVFQKWADVAHRIKEPWQFVYWCNQFKCTEQELKDAIKAVGNESDMVGIHMKAEEDRHASQQEQV
jgi:hypothetical protein